MNALRNALHDLADSAPASPLPTDLWERGRASRRTARLQLIAAALVVIACLAASVGLLRPVVTAAPASGLETDGSLPATVYEPRGALADVFARDPGESRSEKDLSVIGRVSAAVTDNPRQPLLVSAVDGSHHIVDLPDRFDLGLTPSAPVLPSPDGWKVAYAWAAPAETTAQTRAGVAWVDLRTGVVTQVAVQGKGGHPVLVEELTWSSDGRHVAWLGTAQRHWDTGNIDSRPSALEVGTIQVDETEPTTWTVRRDQGMRTESAAIAADEQGLPIVVAGRKLWTFDSDQPRARTVLGKRTQAIWSTATLAKGRLVVGRNTPETTGDNVVGTAEIDLTSDEPRATLSLWGQLPEGSVIEPLGVTPSGRVVATVWPRDGNLVDSVRVEARSSDGTVETLTRRNTSLQASLTVATDLADQPVVDFPEPEWPLSTEQIVGRVVLGSGVVLLAGAVVVLIWRRRRQPHSPG